jgi:hypothetical protein
LADKPRVWRDGYKMAICPFVTLAVPGHRRQYLAIDNIGERDSGRGLRVVSVMVRFDGNRTTNTPHRDYIEPIEA